MSNTTIKSAPTRHIAASPSRLRSAGVLALAVVLAGVGNVAVAAIAHAAGASERFRPLHPATFLPLTVIGLLAGACGWAAIRERSRQPGRTLRWSVPSALGLSFAPDVAVLVSGSMPGTSTGAVLALMAMHLVVAAVAIPGYHLALTLPAPADGHP